VKFPSTSFRLSRKLLVILAGVMLLTGASGAAAILVERDRLLGPPAEEVSGAACTTVTTVRLDRNGQQWLRKYVRSQAKDGDVRVKTALRVAGAVSNREEADLYQVILLDAAGPQNRADMRGRAIGAEVLFSRDPSAIPGMAAPFVARYTTGQPADNGEFYGERKELSLDEIKTIVTAMKDRTDCVEANAEGTEAAVEKEKTGGHAAAEAPAHEVAANGH